jgi:23S rRNA pseudouridine2604 synthase
MSENKFMEENQNTIRINKYLSEAGICSRREADRWIEQGRITVDGRVACTGERILRDARICLDGKEITPEEKRVLLLFYKPRGIVCSTRKQFNETTVTEYLDYPIRVYPVGRLDRESEGLLLLTNQGDLVNKIMRAGNYHEKEYLVEVDKPVTEDFLNGMSGGVPILDTVTRPCTIRKTGRNSFRIVLTQGLNRQIRRMCEYFGYRVLSLKRVRIMQLTLDGLKEGEYREITDKEWKDLNQKIAGSYSETIAPSGGHYAKLHRRDEKSFKKTSGSVKGVLPGRQGNHEQPRVRRAVRRSGETRNRDRDRSGRVSHGKRRI